MCLFGFFKLACSFEVALLTESVKAKNLPEFCISSRNFICKHLWHHTYQMTWKDLMENRRINLCSEVNLYFCLVVTFREYTCFANNFITFRVFRALRKENCVVGLITALRLQIRPSPTIWIMRSNKIQTFSNF